MEKRSITLGGVALDEYVLDTAVVGSGAAGYAAANHLCRFGCECAIITEGIGMGTSRNTGSDKQTYYKLSLASETPDSVRAMARTLHAGGAHGDIALVEAAGSARAFSYLAELGVPFARNRYGEFVGYKTDHDPLERASSAGPLTSRYMVERFEEEARRVGVRVFDRTTAVALAVSDGALLGLLAVRRDAARPEEAFVFFRVNALILATGGPAAVYANRVYPACQTGMTGMALEAGAQAENLQDWQYGIASTKFRWNLSGSYQQVLPRYFSVGEDGVQREFLADALGERSCELEFYKGYEWPFDVRKLGASSMVDLLVHRETVMRGRRVFLDYREEPSHLAGGWACAPQAARDYIGGAGAEASLPIRRLERLNPRAVQLYAAHGIDLSSEPLEARVCAQHHNGGLAVDANFQTNIAGLYAVGEAAGTFGAYRPGGAALNSGQVGALRAAEHIAKSGRNVSSLSAQAQRTLAERIETALACARRADMGEDYSLHMQRFAQRMSACAAFLRDVTAMERLRADILDCLHGYNGRAGCAGVRGMETMLKARDTLITQAAVLDAMLLSARTHGSRGSACVIDGEWNGALPPCVRPSKEGGAVLTERSAQQFASRIRPIRPIPPVDRSFEAVLNAQK